MSDGDFQISSKIDEDGFTMNEAGSLFLDLLIDKGKGEGHGVFSKTHLQTLGALVCALGWIEIDEEAARLTAPSEVILEALDLLGVEIKDTATGENEKEKDESGCGEPNCTDSNCSGDCTPELLAKRYERLPWLDE